MALSGLDIYKMLPGGQKPPHPKANCKECGYPTCLAFAMKLAAKQADLSACQYVSGESVAKLSDAAAPPIRLITLSSNGHKLEVGNETVLFRHEKTFFHKPGLFVKVNDGDGLEVSQQVAAAVDAYAVDYVGMALSIDGFAVAYTSGNPETYGSGGQGRL